jgi:thioredoxin-dependent peroxiredoxin
MVLRAGEQAPDFTLPDQTGVGRRLSDYKGQWVLVYFYPKDDTPGCTTEACGFRDALPKFTSQAVTILGISVDSVKSHQKFVKKFGLPFTLLSDEQKNVVKKYGVWDKKKMMGREYYGTVRTSFLIDPTGTIVKVYEAVKPDRHPAQVLADLAALT